MFLYQLYSDIIFLWNFRIYFYILDRIEPALAVDASQDANVGLHCCDAFASAIDSCSCRNIVTHFFGCNWFMQFLKQCHLFVRCKFLCIFEIVYLIC